ncbi:Aste57867_12712 [Aphanomyces stellatus]|uniref:Aste57867_12712 protein n=1 Tax=Aphanomyces stellatus TaxID=120398 RepID=A0A485KXN3_9STRA|nr:hypothetical protein As57867_012664 [Aphanomyces stellatus]VFT89562.1 Aste57867_12712 [Aphanomyces stellatus]
MDVSVGYYLEKGEAQALLNDVAPYLPDRLVTGPTLPDISLSQPTSPRRFKFHHAPDGTLHVTVLSNIQPATLYFFVVLDLIVVGFFLSLVYPSTVAPIDHSIIRLSVVFGVAIAAISFAILRESIGVKQYIVSSTTWTYEWRVLCFGAIKHYDVQAMGSLQLIANTFVVQDSKCANVSRVAAQHLLGFQYGGAMVFMHQYLEEDQVAPLLDAIRPYLPQHLFQPRAKSTVSWTMEAMSTNGNHATEPLTSTIQPSYS